MPCMLIESWQLQRGVLIPLRAGRVAMFVLIPGACSVVTDFDGLVGSSPDANRPDATSDAPAETSLPDAPLEAPLDTSTPDAPMDAPSEAGCSSGTKWCGSTCVPIDDPQFGCGQVGCEPCDIANAIAKCSAGQCALAACESNFEDCDEVDTGCEADLRTDGNHCGECDRDCGGGDCLGGTCQPVQLANFQREAWSIGVDSTHVYWTTAGGTGWNVQRVSKNGGTAQGLAGPSDSPASQGQLVLDATHVYWANQDTGQIRRMAKDGSGQELLAQGDIPMGIAVDDAHVYWSNRKTTNGSVARVPKSGGTSQVLASALSQPGILAIDADFVYWTGYGDGSVWRAPKTVPATPKVLWNPNVGAAIAGWGIVVDDANVYWRSEPDLWWIPKTGTTATKLLEPQPHARFLALAGGSLFWGRKRATEVSFELVSLSTSSLDAQPTVLAGGLGGVHGVTADDDYVYWTEWSADPASPSAGVYKIRRP